jgi:hypothetical protein
MGMIKGRFMFKKFGLPILVAGIFCLTATSGHAVFELGKSLKFKCMGELNSNEEAQCLGYLSGIADVMMEGNKINKFKACIPETVNDTEILTIIRKVLKDNPSNLHYTGSDLVAYAFQEAYPCD